MCGICGFAYSDPTRRADAQRLVVMRDTIVHRGPDGAGEYRSGAVALGHRRLSIIDLAGGTQPLSNEDGSVWITFNGEIYNYQELTAHLISRGHRFRTRSDTEAIVHAYEEYGLDFPRYLNGMFALAIHDQRNHRVVLARDHLGIKPLFYSVTDEGLFFGSEVKAVLSGSGRAASPRPEALAEYLLFRYVAGSRSFFSAVNRLPAGHLAVWQHERLDVRCYWSLPAPSNEPSTDGESLDALDRLLGASVESQLMSEVPLGTFCSGGLDSGLVTGYAARSQAEAVKTFSVGFDDPFFDESRLARMTAARYGTDHHVVVAGAAQVRQLLPTLLWHNDEPLSHPNSAPLYVLSKVAREQVTVVLTGEGSDEMFAGYPRYHLARIRAALDSHVAGAAPHLSGFLRAFSSRRAALLARQLSRSPEQAIVLNSAYVPPEAVGSLLARNPLDALDERLEIEAITRVQGNAVASLSRYEMATYLGCALDRMDRMSMAHGLEGRVPFLDVRLVEWAARLSVRQKVRGRTNKFVVKQLASRMLDRDLVRGPKSGFGLPLGAWFRSGPFRDLVERLLDTRHPAAHCFEQRFLARMVREHRLGTVDHGELLWLVTNVYLWFEQVAGASHFRGNVEAPVLRNDDVAVASAG